MKCIEDGMKIKHSHTLVGNERNEQRHKHVHTLGDSQMWRERKNYTIKCSLFNVGVFFCVWRDPTLRCADGDNPRREHKAKLRFDLKMKKKKHRKFDACVGLAAERTLCANVLTILLTISKPFLISYYRPRYAYMVMIQKHTM